MKKGESKKRKRISWEEKSKKEKIVIIILAAVIAVLAIYLAYDVYDSFKTKEETSFLNSAVVFVR